MPSWSRLCNFNYFWVILRYFNACGADTEVDIGEDHLPETHLIPNILKAAAAKQTLTIFGRDFPTADGTCVRDYIHVRDLADAHLKAAEYVLKCKRGTFDAFHLGTGQGLSNLEIVAAAGRVLSQKIAYEFGDRRAGDPPALFADNSKAKRLLGFQPRFSDIDGIVGSAWAWHSKYPKGYR